LASVGEKKESTWLWGQGEKERAAIKGHEGETGAKKKGPSTLDPRRQKPVKKNQKKRPDQCDGVGRLQTGGKVPSNLLARLYNHASI